MRQKHSTNQFSEPVIRRNKVSLYKKILPIMVLLGVFVSFGIWLSYRFGPTIVPSGFPAPPRNDVPMRPGISGIVLSGPIKKPLIFKINEMRPGVVPLNWNELVGRSTPAAIITIQGKVFGDGRLIIDNVQDGGFPAAGTYVRQCIDSWFYTPYLNGRIKYTIRVGAKRIDVDATKLKKNNPSGPQVIIDKEKICFIRGNADLYVDEPVNL